MLVCKKHPDSEEILAVDFIRRLASGETVASVVTQPVMVSPAGNTDLVFGTAAVNTSAPLNVPNNGAQIAQNQGISFTCSGGIVDPTNGTNPPILPDGNIGQVYEFKGKVATSNSPRTIGWDMQLWVSKAY